MWRFVAGCRRGVGSDCASSVAVGRGLSAVGMFMGGLLLSEMCHAGVALGTMPNLTHFYGWLYVNELLGA